MKVFPDFAAFHATAQGPSAVTVGNFDGCHLGHQALLERVVEAADDRGGPAVGVTFAPRPDAFFRGVEAETLLFTAAQKRRALSEAGLDALIEKAFDAGFSKLSPKAFFDECLRAQLDTTYLIVGDNFRFGHGRAGDGAFLKERGKAKGVEVELGSAVAHRGERISSTRIRAALAAGAVEDVAAMLGRPYLLEGVIARGDQIGRTLGVPTANLESVGQLVPGYGIYAGWAWLNREADDAPLVMMRDQRVEPAVFSVGVRPTLEQKAPPLRIEAHLLGGPYEADAFYGMRAGYYFTHRLRDELKLDGLEALKAQMQKDIAAARAILK